MKKVIFLLLIIPLYLYPYLNLNLKDEIYVLTNKIQLGKLFYNNLDFNYFLDINENFLPNYKIANILHNIGLQDFILLGNGIKINFVKKSELNSLNDIENFINNNYKNLNHYKLSFNLPENFKILKIEDKILITNLFINLNLICFYDYSGELTNIELLLPIENRIKISDNNIFTNIKNNINLDKNDINLCDEHIFIRNIFNGFADIVYIKGILEIQDRVKIIKKLDDRLYLVENAKSGKKIIAKLMNENF